MRIGYLIGRGKIVRSSEFGEKEQVERKITGLGQGMALSLADAGADIVGVDYVDMPEVKEKNFQIFMTVA